jgi:ribonuclease-3
MAAIADGRDASLPPDLMAGFYRRYEAAKSRAGRIDSRVAKNLGLPPYLRLGKGEEITGGRERDALVADAMEAVIGALYLSEGFPAARDFVVSHWEDEVNHLEDGEAVVDPKSALQELTQARSQERPVYRIVREEGPDHHKEFVVEVLFEGKKVGEGKGSTKKAAEQAAALVALQSLKPEE